MGRTLTVFESRLGRIARSVLGNFAKPTGPTLGVSCRKVDEKRRQYYSPKCALERCLTHLREEAPQVGLEQDGDGGLDIVLGRRLQGTNRSI